MTEKALKQRSDISQTTGRKLGGALKTLSHSAIFLLAASLSKFACAQTALPPVATPSAANLQLSSLARTKGNDPSWAKFASGTGNLLFLGAGTLLPLLEDGKAGGQHTYRTADAVIVSTLFSESLKRIVREKRPDGTNRESFPSGHATAAFAVATMQAHYHPGQALLWYGGATLIAASRVTLHRHYTHDVIAGAALGFLTSKLELKQNRGLLLRPFIHQDSPTNRVSGLSVGSSF